MRVDENGIAWVWLLKERRGNVLVDLPPAEQKWVKRWPIDAKELIASGEAAEKKPDDPKAVPAGFPEDGPPKRADVKERLDRLSHPVLRELCDAHKVPWIKNDGKAALVSKLLAAGVVDIPEPTRSLAGVAVESDDAAA